jgi:hypothetical protein
MAPERGICASIEIQSSYPHLSAAVKTLVEIPTLTLGAVRSGGMPEMTEATGRRLTRSDSSSRGG